MGRFHADGRPGGSLRLESRRKEYRRLTDDAFRDRGPSWAPDGKTIAFYSDRGGTYQIWTIRPDGSGLERLTSFTGSANFPVWSPDGKQIACSVIGGTGGWHLIVARSARFPRPERSMPPLEGSAQFWPVSWSPDGGALAGIAANSDGSFDSVVVYFLAANRYERVETRSNRMWNVPVWLADSSRLLIRDARGISLYNLATKRSRLLIPVGGYGIGLSLGISRDNRWITYTETATEGDIWVADLK